MSRTTTFLSTMALVSVLVCASAVATAQGQSIRNREPSWSPDGSTIAFVSNRDGNPELYLMDADGTNHRNVSGSPAFDMGLAWSRDSKHLAFVSNRDGARDLYLIRVERGESKRLTRRGDVLSSPLAWSPDGLRLVFAAGSHQNALALR